MRKLATAAIAFSAAVFAANYIIPFEWLKMPALLLAAAGAALFAVGGRQPRPAASVLLFFALGLGCFYLHSNATVQKAKEYNGQTHRVEAEVLTYPEVYDDYCRLEVKVTSHYLPNLKAYLYDNDKQLTGARPGDRVYLSAKVSPADTLYGEQYSGYHAKGIYLKLSSKGEIGLERGGFDIFTLPRQLSHWLSSRIEQIFPEDTAVFMRSLMLGDKTDFYGDESLYVSMSRAGLMHIVAVSGMHVSYLVSLLYHIFGKGKRSALICLVLVWLFALVTGAGPSVLRASFMCSTLLLAPVLQRENDSITSLSAVLAAILCINPFAAASISLQLSFGAMAGIVFLGGRIYRALADRLGNIVQNGLVRSVLISVSNSLSVMVFTVTLTAVHFGTVPLLSPVTNLVSLWAVSLCFCGGWLSCGLSVFPFAGEASALLVSWLARYIFLAAELISSVPFAVLYVQTKGTWIWIGISYALFAVFILLKIGLMRSCAYAGLASLGLLVALISINNRYYKNTESISVLNVGQGQCITVLTDETTAVLDCGNIYTIDDAGTLAAGHLYSRGRNTVDYLLLSHLHADHANGAVTLMETIEVETLILPYDHDDSDGLYTEIIECAKKNGTEIIKIYDDRVIDCGDVVLNIYKGGESEEENERCLITKLDAGKISLLALADSTAQMQRELLQEQELDGVDAFVVSHHGSKYSCCEELLDEVGGDAALVSVGHNYYGHPAEETLEALERWGYNVYRTDLHGNLEIRIGQ